MNLPFAFSAYMRVRRLYHFENRNPCEVLNVFTQLLASGGMAQFLERLDFDLPDPFPGEIEVLADLFERVLATDANAEPHPDYLLFPLGER